MKIIIRMNGCLTYLLVIFLIILACFAFHIPIEFVALVVACYAFISNQ